MSGWGLKEGRSDEMFPPHSDCVIAYFHMGSTCLQLLRERRKSSAGRLRRGRSEETVNNGKFKSGAPSFSV